MPSFSTSFALTALVLLRDVALAEDHLISRSLKQRHFKRADPFNLTLFHVNDMHAHMDEVVMSGQDCADPSKGCYGGYARVKGVLDERRPSSDNNSLLLNIGDEFQGTLFYSFYGGEKLAEVINEVGFDAMVLGNHEFDRGEEYLGEFIQNLTVPVLCANIDTKEESLNSTIKPYKVFPELRTALIALTTDTIPAISRPNNDTTFSSPVSTTQFWADYIYANEPDVERIVAMTHIGYEEDMKLARETTGIQVIVGGHSHTLLGDMAGAQGKYPTVETNQDGDEVFVVTAWRYGVYLGYIDVEFDGGKVLSYTGGPILLNNKTAQDTKMQAQIKEWRGPFEEFASTVIGTNEVKLNRENCKTQECNWGDFTCDAMIASRANQSTIAGCILNGGGIRADVEVGDITRGHVITAFPFNNALAEAGYTGDDLWKIFEGVVSGVSQFNDKPVVSWAQTGGFKIKYNPANEPGSRLISLEIADGELVERSSREYRVVTSDFVATGGDNIVPVGAEYVVLATLDELLVDYIEDTTPISVELQNRYEVTEETQPAVIHR
ncbi:Metallo-dependent phosphatase-like protein [Pterulicium gracile]|uniref:Metallo-dependent phosphatase-like protein n=1 Tax=Pterulicium gracile TaxID=1884261 RepID=A0A5C3Q7N2_9AGAR|nr:Metallo-dependent phosphatase-like protein [Pterula gracilis]